MFEQTLAGRQTSFSHAGGFSPTGGAEMLDLLEQGILLVERAANILFANKSAEEVLSAGLGLHVHGGRVFGGTCAETTTLHRLIAGCASGNADIGGSFALSRGFGSAPLFVLVAPVAFVTDRVSDLRPVAMMFVTDPERVAVVSERQLRDGFGLTRAEAAVTLELVKGDGLQAAASRLKVSLGTVRTHLSQVFAKTSTSRQAELVRLILASRPNVRSSRIAGQIAAS